MVRRTMRVILLGVLFFGISIAIEGLTDLRMTSSFTDTTTKPLTQSDEVWFSKAEQAEDSYLEYGEDQGRLDIIWKRLYVEHSELSPSETIYLNRRAEIKPSMDRVEKAIAELRSFINDTTIEANRNNPSIDQLGFVSIKWKGRNYMITQQKIDGDHYIAIDVYSHLVEYVYRNGSLLKR